MNLLYFWGLSHEKINKDCCGYSYCICIIVWVISSYNELVAKNETVETLAWRSRQTTNFQRRNDLIPNLVATVKQYAAHESEVFAQVSEARSSWQNPSVECCAGRCRSYKRLVTVTCHSQRIILSLKPMRILFSCRMSWREPKTRIAVARKIITSGTTAIIRQSEDFNKHHCPICLG